LLRRSIRPKCGSGRPRLILSRVSDAGAVLAELACLAAERSRASVLMVSVGDVWRPDWRTYPTQCERGHPWGPGRVIVSWMPCQCEPARAAQPRGSGHRTITCRTGCESVVYEPRHDPDRRLRPGSSDEMASCRDRCRCRGRVPGAAHPRLAPNPGQERQSWRLSVRQPRRLLDRLLAAPRPASAL
jgi:hypothetical protein